MDTYGLFPTPVVKFEMNREFTEEEIDFVLKCENRLSGNNSCSVDHFVLDNLKLKNIKKFILESINSYVKHIINPEKKIEVYITQSWLNYTKKHQSHHRHFHTNSFISGTLYFSSNENDRITFFKPSALTSIINITSTEFNSFNSTSWWLPSKKGSMYIFPSSLEHAVEEKKDDNLRISLSFNTFIKGEIGKIDDATYLKL